MRFKNLSGHLLANVAIEVLFRSGYLRWPLEVRVEMLRGNIRDNVSARLFGISVEAGARSGTAPLKCLFFTIHSR